MRKYGITRLTVSHVNAWEVCTLELGSSSLEILHVVPYDLIICFKKKLGNIKSAKLNFKKNNMWKPETMLHKLDNLNSVKFRSHEDMTVYQEEEADNVLRLLEKSVIYTIKLRVEEIMRSLKGFQNVFKNVNKVSLTNYFKQAVRAYSWEFDNYLKAQPGEIDEKLTKYRKLHLQVWGAQSYSPFPNIPPLIEEDTSHRISDSEYDEKVKEILPDLHIRLMQLSVPLPESITVYRGYIGECQTEGYRYISTSVNTHTAYNFATNPDNGYEEGILPQILKIKLSKGTMVFTTNVSAMQKEDEIVVISNGPIFITIEGDDEEVDVPYSVYDDHAGAETIVPRKVTMKTCTLNTVCDRYCEY